jgi:dUTPase
MNNTVKILNEFGIKPTNNHTSAGADFYIPYFTEDKQDVAFEAFKKSYGASNNDLPNIKFAIKEIMSRYSIALNNEQLNNALHLYLALDSSYLKSFEDFQDKITNFCTNYLKIDEKTGKPGLELQFSDSLLINSGIRVALNPGTAGIFFNKSGRGNSGWDVRAQVVDEDYTGFVHLSLSYTKKTPNGKSTIFCGDKLTQMVILPVIHSEYEETTIEDYYKTMSNSERGNNGFGSSDEKH